MARLIWGASGDRTFENGCDRGVLYKPTGGVYSEGYAWNGLTSVSENPSGGEATPMYADNREYLNMISLERFGATIEAYTYPDAFNEFDGNATPQVGVIVGQQPRKTFGLSYRTMIGNDQNPEEGYYLHLVYGCTAAPSGKDYATINDSPEAVSFSYEISTTPVDVPVNNLKPTAHIKIDSRKVTADNLAALEDALYGTAATDPRLPLPEEIITMFSGSQVEVITTAPTFVAATGVITIPTVTGVQYRRADTNAIVTGTVTIPTAGASLVITANPASGAYKFKSNSDDDWSFTRD